MSHLTNVFVDNQLEVGGAADSMLRLILDPLLVRGLKPIKQVLVRDLV